MRFWYFIFPVFLLLIGYNSVSALSSVVPEIKPKTEPFIPTPRIKPAQIVGTLQSYQITKEETLLDVARFFNLGFVELQAANPNTDPWLPRENTKIILPTQHLLPEAKQEGIVINLGDMRLYLFDDRGRYLLSHPIGVGREGLYTPIGKTIIRDKKEGPWWYPTDRMRLENPTLQSVVKQGPQNPLGTHALYLGWPTFAIHGTNEPWGIGRRVSSGCIRLYPEDIKTLYPKVDVNTSVQVVNQPIKAGWYEGACYLEAHPNEKQASAIEYEQGQPFDIPIGTLEWLKQKAGQSADKIDWDHVYQILTERRGYPIKLIKTATQQEKDKKNQQSKAANQNPLPYN